MKVLVTGGAGFVGRHIAKHCVDLKYDVVIVDDMSTGIPWRKWPDFLQPKGFDVARITEISDDLRHYMRHYAKASEFDLIFHCAAVVGGRKMIDGAPLHVATDLSIDAEFFNWCCAENKKPGKVVYFSSSAVYPTQLQTREIHVRLNEALVKIGIAKIGMPDAAYGWAKLSGEFLMHHAVKSYGLDCVCYRPFSGYGEDQDFSYPFPTLVRRVGRCEDPILIWGSGDQVRDFIHIDDIVDMIFESFPKMPAGETVNLGSGQPLSFKEFVNITAAILGHSTRIETRVDEPEGVFYRVADIHRMEQYCGLPKISLAEGIRRVHRYQSKNGLLTPPEKV